MGLTPCSAAGAPAGLLVPCEMPLSSFRVRDEGVPRGPGGPPHKNPPMVTELLESHTLS